MTKRFAGGKTRTMPQQSATSKRQHVAKQRAEAILKSSAEQRITRSRRRRYLMKVARLSQVRCEVRIKRQRWTLFGRRPKSWIGGG